MKISNVTVVGGTHGNEFTGVYLIKKLRLEQFQYKWDELKIELIIGNPRAYEKSTRFVDHDLNRAFLKDDLADLELAGYEANRAKVINQKVGPKDSPKTDLIIDLHTTTANMGVSIILLDENLFNLQMAAYIQGNIADSYIYSCAGSKDHPFLASLAPYGFILEVGPTPNGIVRQDIFDKTKSTLDAAFEFIAMTNSGEPPEVNRTIEVFKHKGSVEFPRDQDGNINAIVHSNIQDKDYQPINKDDPLFVTLEGETVTFQNNETSYPVFINEAAYYSTDMAFGLTEKVIIDLDRQDLGEK